MTKLLQEIHSTQPEKGKYLSELRKPTIEDLFHTAHEQWALDEAECRKALKDGGFPKFYPHNWMLYIQVLREFHTHKWAHELTAQRIEEKERLRERICELLAKRGTLAIIVEPSSWRYEGTSEQMAAHWELEELYLQERVKKARLRYRYE